MYSPLLYCTVLKYSPLLVYCSQDVLSPPLLCFIDVLSSLMYCTAGYDYFAMHCNGSYIYSILHRTTYTAPNKQTPMKKDTTGNHGTWRNPPHPTSGDAAQERQWATTIRGGRTSLSSFVWPLDWRPPLGAYSDYPSCIVTVTHVQTLNKWMQSTSCYDLSSNQSSKRWTLNR